MSTIGYFKKTGDSFIGEIITLTLRAAGVRIMAQDTTENEKAPTHRVYIGRAEVGAGWTKTSGFEHSEACREYISFKLDDPSFDAPIYASLFEDENAEGCYNLVWSRPRKNGM